MFKNDTFFSISKGIAVKSNQAKKGFYAKVFSSYPHSVPVNQFPFAYFIYLLLWGLIMKKSTAIYNTKPPDMSRVKIKFSGFKNALYILPQDKAEKLLKKVYKEKFNYLKLSGCDACDCVLKVEMNLIRITQLKKC